MMKERKCKDCPAFYECKDDFLNATAGGWAEKKLPEGGTVLCCRPAPVRGGGRRMQKFSFYCLATNMGKKIGSKASWTGRTPTWCPLGREKGEDHE